MSYYQANVSDLGVYFDVGSEFDSAFASECTYIFVWFPADVTAQGLLSITQSGGQIASLNNYNDGKIYYALNGNFVASSVTYAVADHWRIDVIRKPAAGVNSPRHSYYVYDEGVWHHTDMVGTVGNSTNSTPGFDQFVLWMFDSDEKLYGNAAGFAITHQLLSDGDCDGLEKGIPEWVSRGYEFVMSHDQSAKTDAVFQRGSGSSTFAGYGSAASDPSTVDWTPGFYTVGLAPFNPPAPWSYSVDVQAADTDSLYKQRLTFTDSFGDADGWTLGMRASSYVDGSVVAIWFFPPAGATGDFGWVIYAGHVGEAGGVLASGTIADGTYDPAGGWQRYAITPVDVSGINFMPCIELPADNGTNNYRYTAMDGTHLVSPPLDDAILVSSGGCFKDSHAKPDNSTANIYNVDFEFLPASGGGPVYASGQFFPFFR